MDMKTCSRYIIKLHQLYLKSLGNNHMAAYSYYKVMFIMKYYTNNRGRVETQLAAQWVRLSIDVQISKSA